jgi:hypothetical protein
MNSIERIQDGILTVGLDGVMNLRVPSKQDFFNRFDN